MRRLNDESGVSTVIVALVIVVLLGILGFVIDFGNMYEERRELQNGADAAALAVAADCAGDACGDTIATATQYANSNARDGSAGVDFVDLDLGAHTVRVQTSTVTSGGGTILRPLVAQVLGYNGTTVRAAASAAWGGPGAATVLPIIFSDCEWEKVQSSVQPEPYPPFTIGTSIIYFHGPGSTNDPKNPVCHESPSGQDLPGGFGWLKSTTGPCEADLAVGSWVRVDTGESPPASCSANWMKNLVGTVVLIPFFDDLRGTGANSEYHVSGFGALWVTGYNFGGQYKEPSKTPCKGNDRCIEGYFVEATTYDGEPGGPDRGVSIIYLNG